jgi:hypothetical protein
MRVPLTAIADRQIARRGQDCKFAPTSRSRLFRDFGCAPQYARLKVQYGVVSQGLCTVEIPKQRCVEMKQLVDPNAVERVLLFVAVAGPLVGLIIGALVGAHEKCAARRVIAGVLLGGIGPLVYWMWRLYGAITNTLGLDSVANLALQLIMFAALGALLGALMLRVSMLIKRIGAD